MTHCRNLIIICEIPRENNGSTASNCCLETSHCFDVYFDIHIKLCNTFNDIGETTDDKWIFFCLLLKGRLTVILYNFIWFCSLYSFSNQFSIWFSIIFWVKFYAKSLMFKNHFQHCLSKKKNQKLAPAAWMEKMLII